MEKLRKTEKCSRGSDRHKNGGKERQKKKLIAIGVLLINSSKKVTSKHFIILQNIKMLISTKKMCWNERNINHQTVRLFIRPAFSDCLPCMLVFRSITSPEEACSPFTCLACLSLVRLRPPVTSWSNLDTFQRRPSAAMIARENLFPFNRQRPVSCAVFAGCRPSN